MNILIALLQIIIVVFYLIFYFIKYININELDLNSLLSFMTYQINMGFWCAFVSFRKNTTSKFETCYFFMNTLILIFFLLYIALSGILDLEHLLNNKGNLILNYLFLEQKLKSSLIIINLMYLLIDLYLGKNKNRESIVVVVV